MDQILATATATATKELRHCSAAHVAEAKSTFIPYESGYSTDTFHPLLKVYGIVTVGGLEAMELVVQLQRVSGRWIPLQHVHQRYLYACHQD